MWKIFCKKLKNYFFFLDRNQLETILSEFFFGLRQILAKPGFSVLKPAATLPMAPGYGPLQVKGQSKGIRLRIQCSCYFRDHVRFRLTWEFDKLIFNLEIWFGVLKWLRSPKTNFSWCLATDYICQKSYFFAKIPL